MQYLSNGTTMKRDEAASAIASHAQQLGEADPSWNQQLPLGTNWSSIVGARVFPVSNYIPYQLRKNHPQMTGQYTTKALDVSDLQFPIPAGAYFEALDEGQCYARGAVQRGCATIVEDLFVPRLELQDVIRQVDPAFRRCSLLWPGGVLDPPIVLKPTTVFDVPKVAALTTSGASMGTFAIQLPIPIPIPAGRIEHPLPSQTISVQPPPESPPLDSAHDRGRDKVIDRNLIASAILGSDVRPIIPGDHGFSTVIIASHTLSIGGPAAEIAGQVVSLASQGLIVGTTSIAFPSPTANPPLELLIGHETVAAKRVKDGIVVDSVSLRPGGPEIVVKSHTLSMSGTNLLVDGTVASIRTKSEFWRTSTPVWNELETSHDRSDDYDGSDSWAPTLSNTHRDSSKKKSDAPNHRKNELCLMWLVMGLAVLLMFL
jgi:hypothetical protein